MTKLGNTSDLKIGTSLIQVDQPSQLMATIVLQKKKNDKTRNQSRKAYGEHAQFYMQPRFKNT